MRFLVDLHVHGPGSPCSFLTAETIAAGARARGLDGVAVVDHDALPAEAVLARLADLGVPAFGGAEVTTAHGDLLVFGVSRVPPPGLPGPEVVRRVWAEGGFAALAHPFRRGRAAAPELLALPGLPLEAPNGRAGRAANAVAAAFARRHGRARVAGSDAHRPAEVGCHATALPYLPSGSRDLARALLTLTAPESAVQPAPAAALY